MQELKLQLLIKLPDFGDMGNLCNMLEQKVGWFYTDEGRAQLMLILQKLTKEVIHERTGARVKLTQYIEGGEEAKLPALRDIIDNQRDYAHLKVDKLWAAHQKA